jgi:cytochrome c
MRVVRSTIRTRTRIQKALLTMALLSITLCFTAGCNRARGATYENAVRLTGGDPHAGATHIRQYGCSSCHTIPGIPGARGLVGPPLNNIAVRQIIAGQLPNTPENTMLWIRHPRSVLPHTVMPEMGVTEQDSRDITAYLYTLK